MRLGRQLLEEHLREETWQPEVVQAGYALYSDLGRLEATVDLLRGYLAQALPMEEEAWARWHLTDQLAMLRRCDETVASHTRFLAWAWRVLPQPDWFLWPDWPFGWPIPAERSLPADECLLISVMNDSTQGACWVDTGQIDEWFAVFHELLASVPPTARNRSARRLYVRTAGEVLVSAHQPAGIFPLADQLRAVSAEDPDWPEAFETGMDALIMELNAYRLLGKVDALRHIGLEAASISRTRQAEQPELLPEQAKKLSTLYHDSASLLYLARQHDLAIPLFQEAIELGSPSPHTYRWLAASLWATTRDRATVLAWLRKVGIGAGTSGTSWRTCPSSRMWPMILSSWRQ